MQLKTNKNEKFIFSRVNNAKINEESIVLWRFAGKTKLTCNGKITFISKFSKEIRITFDEENLKEFKNIISGAESVNVFIPEYAILFQSIIKIFEKDGTLILCFPNTISQLERRKYNRLVIENGIQAKVMFYKEKEFQRKQTQLFNRDLHDISAGGASIIVSRLEGKMFKKGDLLNKLIVLLDNVQFTLRAKVVNMISIEPSSENNLIYKSWKLCFKFVNISKEDLEKINLFVFQNLEDDMLEEKLTGT
jgi:c-di-GMP-binding flagellar brake protein YcgR